MNQRMRKLLGMLLALTITVTIPNALWAEQIPTTDTPVTATETAVPTQDALVTENDSAQVSNPFTPDSAKVMNYANKEDRVIVTGIQQGDVIKVYDETGTQIGSEGVGIGWTSEGAFPVNIGELAVGDKISVTLTREGKLECEKLELSVGETPVTDQITADQVKISNTVPGYTTITVTGLKADTAYDGNNLVNVYNSTGMIIGSGIFLYVDQETEINIKNSLIDDGNLTISYTQDGKIESEKLGLTVAAEFTNALTPDRVKVMNYINKKDRVLVTGIQQGDVIKVYNAVGTQIGSAGVGIGWTSNDNFPVDIGELAVGDKIAVTLTQEGKIESDKLELIVGETPVTDKITKDQVKITTSVSGYTTITVTGLKVDTARDVNNILRIYDYTGKLIATGSVHYRDQKATIVIRSFLINGRNIAISYTQDGKLVSERLELTPSV